MRKRYVSPETDVIIINVHTVLYATSPGVSDDSSIDEGDVGAKAGNDFGWDGVNDVTSKSLRGIEEEPDFAK